MHFSTEPPGHCWAVCPGPPAFVAGRRRLDDDGLEACCCPRLLAEVGRRPLVLPWVEAVLDDDEAFLFTGLFFGGLLFMNP